MTEGRIFAIKRFALHDGPGIRTTVFLKGCPLRCLWCHNPEGLSHEQQLAFYPHLCIACDNCYRACLTGALRKTSTPIKDYEEEVCVLCGKCAEACPAGAIQLVGRDVSAEEVIGEVERDRRFYEVSGGGMTISGGEPLSQPDFTCELLSLAKARRIHTILDTSGQAKPEDLGRCLDWADHVYYDVKVVDDEKHRRLVGASNVVMLENLKRVCRSVKPLTIRIPLVKGLNDSPEDISALADLIASFPATTNLQRIELLPYHRIGEGKYGSVRLDYPLKGHQVHSVEELESVVGDFRARGLTVYSSQLDPPSLGARGAKPL
jgi:pyruvate formate lyase activating enzyme